MRCGAWTMWRHLRRSVYLRYTLGLSATERVLSSVGRAAPLQGVGREFETLSTHQMPLWTPIESMHDYSDSAILAGLQYLER